MNTAEIIMQQKKIAEEKEKAEQELAYTAIKEWVEEHVDSFCNRLLSRVSKRFLSDNISAACYECISGTCEYPLGKDFPEAIGLEWNVRYSKKNSDTKVFKVSFVDEFFSENPIKRNHFTQNTCKLFISQMLFHTALPEFLKKEGFNVSHSGCGCCERIVICLPDD